jgi:hypothetical protein
MTLTMTLRAIAPRSTITTARWITIGSFLLGLSLPLIGGGLNFRSLRWRQSG